MDPRALSVYHIPELAEMFLAHLSNELLRALFADEDVKALIIKVYKSNTYWKHKSEVLLGYRSDVVSNRWMFVYEGLTTGLQRFFQLSCKEGYWDVFSLLIKDRRIDPSIGANYAICQASFAGREDMVASLMEDERVDPSGNDNFSILWAEEMGYSNVIALLRRDPRVNMLT